MAVVTLYMSDRDESKQFTSKKEADDYDKKLELGSALGEFLDDKLASLSEEMAEEIGMLLADNKELLMAALKGKPGVLNESADNKVSNIADAS